MENLVQIAIQNVNMAAILPSVILTCFAMGLLLINVFLPRGTTRHAVWISLVGLLVTGFFVYTGWGDPQYGFNDAVALDNYAAFFSMICLIAAGLTILMSDDYLHREGYPISEYYPLIMFTTACAMLMASGTEMMTIFLGLEGMSIGLYVLAGFMRNDIRSNEAGLKYFLLGSFSSGFMLYGMALIYGVTGSTKLTEIGVHLSTHGSLLDNPMTLAGLVLLATGFLFKIAAAPFHMWTPDVYEGAPTSITAFMSVGVKAAAFSAFLRVFLTSFPSFRVDWTIILWVLAVVTMTLGNIVAISQENIKRMLAYSS
ncbi:MAG: NADH-quinone oxidoreductase subunit N, partial [Desulfuromonadales bacterium]|nr:NADH-quinone oxidoreductase subunit N [Desulfuromonadales bacterium]